MFSANNGVILTILLVVLICVAALIGVVYSFAKTVQDMQLGNVQALEPDREVSILEKDINYNFAIPGKEEQKAQQPAAEEKKQEEKTDKQKQEEKPQPVPNTKDYSQKYNYNFGIPAKKPNASMKSIQIPSINYNSPIIVSDDGNKAIDYGAWFYPTSKIPQEGESVFLCHRRYFKSGDPKSCWNLDKVEEGSTLFINFSDGSQYVYKVASVAVAEGSDINIYHSTNEQQIKLISCAKENGQIGSDSYRIVLIADLVSK